MCPQTAAPGLRYVNNDEPGIRRVRTDGGFMYLVPSGRRLKAKRDLERIRKLAIPPAYEDVWICRDAAGHIQAVGRDKRGRKQYRYHAAWREYRDRVKFNRMLAFADALPQLRAQVVHDLRGPGLTRDKVVAAAVALLDTTAVRIGNDEYARANGSFGLTTLRNRHAAVNGSLIQLRFRGKGGKQHEVDFRDRHIARIVARCQELPGHYLFEYVDEMGTTQRVTSTDVNDYLRRVMGDEFSAKDFRTWHASLEFAVQASQSAQRDDSPREGLKAALDRTAARLGNTPAICRKSYVHPALMEALTKNALPAFTRSEKSRAAGRLRNEEAALRRFLKRTTRKLERWNGGT